MKARKRDGRSGVGIVLILVGLLFLAANFSWLPAHIHDVLFSWPMILVGVGIITLTKKEYTATIVLFSIAGYFLLPHFYPEWSFVNVWQFWPILLIIVGLVFIFNRNKSHHHPCMNEATIDDNLIDEVAIFGGRVTRIESKSFRGGKVSCIFGGGELHLENCEISPEGALLDVAAIFGGVKIIVPKEWTVKIEVTSIFGGFTDKRLYASTQGADSKLLVIKGATIFGGGELSNI